jgi:hypothetical protein
MCCASLLETVTEKTLAETRAARRRTVCNQALTQACAVCSPGMGHFERYGDVAPIILFAA